MVRDLMSQEIPPGFVVAWRASPKEPEKIPEGWILCNGSNGTPNIQDPNDYTIYIMKKA